MRLSNLSCVLLAILLLISCAPLKKATHNGEEDVISANQLTELKDLVQQLPTNNSTENVWINEQILDMGSSATQALVGMLKSPGIGNDTYARYAVNGLVKYVSRPGAEAERSSFEHVLLSELQSSHPVAVKIFLMEQLELVGSNASLPVIQPYLADEQLYTAASQVLRSVNTPKAEAALLQALPKATIPHRAVLIKTLGDMEATSSELVRQVQTMANSTNENLKINALYALANSGNPDASETINNYGSVQDKIRFAHRLAEEGYTQQSAQAAREIYNSEQPAHHRIAALTLFHQSQDPESPDLLMTAAIDTHAELRSAALDLIRDIEGTQITSELTNLLNQANPEVRADIIETLGQRGDRQAWYIVQQYMRDDNREVRLAAIGASTALGSTGAIGSLLRALDNADEANEIDVVKKALLQQPSQALFSTAEQQWMNLSTQSKVTLIEVLAQRRGRQYMDQLLSELNTFDGDVRLATFQALSALGTPDDLSRFVNLLPRARNEEETNAIQQAIASVAADIPDEQSRTEPVINALGQPTTEQVPALLETLGIIGGEQAVESVSSYTSHSNTDVRDSAISELANWPDARAIQPILETLETTDAEKSRRLLDGLARIVRSSHYSDTDKVQFLAEAADAVSTEEASILVLGALSGIHSEASLRTVISFFENSSQEVQNKAYQAAAEILVPSYRFSEDFDGAGQALSVLEAATDSTTRQKVIGYIQEFQSQQELSEGFNALFNGTDLTGWTGDKEAYEVQDGQLIHQPGENGHLFSQQEYGDFILRFQFKLTPGANNGLAIRAPLEGNPAYQGMELQILDNSAEKWSDLEPYQYHGSIYGVASAERGHLKPAGEWNTQQVIANGAQITVTLNGVTILGVDLSEMDNSDTPDGEDHPGLSRDSGHIGFMGHGDEVAFRNIQIRDLNVYYPNYMGSEQQAGMNHPPEGYKALFNGENLDGWKGLVGNPDTRAEMSDQELAAAREKADRVMQQHWSVRDGILYFDGNGESLATVEDFKDFEMLLDWKIEPGGDSGVYLRGTPQVQIWDITQNPVGSGGLYNNQQHPSEPLVPADRPIREWNRMRIKMVGEQVTVHLNNQLVVDDVVLENYWNRDKRIYPEGQIELQSHSTPLYFKNVFIREIPRPESLFNGEDLTGWEIVDGESGSWQVFGGMLTAVNQSSGWLSSATLYDNFKLELEYRLPEGGNSGIFLRAPREGNPAYQGMEIQLLDDYAEEYAELEPSQYTGSIYGVKEPSSRATKPAGQWQEMVIRADGPHIKITLNGEIITSTSLVNHMEKVNEHPGLKRRRGYIGLQNHGTVVEFNNIRITEIE
ncbi:family 16 glycoside hydrolase [Rhodohalobacter sp. 8-1]|uniref:family 16 glycoside hydrolase n=1 Tax=Rhodohalobacter sp. 8-1 TaxID=3131972 RepID=UPI0030EEECF1